MGKKAQKDAKIKCKSKNSPCAFFLSLSWNNLKIYGIERKNEREWDEKKKKREKETGKKFAMKNLFITKEFLLNRSYK